MHGNADFKNKKHNIRVVKLILCLGQMRTIAWETASYSSEKLLQRGSRGVQHICNFSEKEYRQSRPYFVERFL